MLFGTKSTENRNDTENMGCMEKEIKQIKHECNVSDQIHIYNCN